MKWLNSFNKKPALAEKVCNGKGKNILNCPEYWSTLAVIS